MFFDIFKIFYQYNWIEKEETGKRLFLTGMQKINTSKPRKKSVVSKRRGRK